MLCNNYPSIGCMLTLTRQSTGLWY